MTLRQPLSIIVLCLSRWQFLKVSVGEISSHRAIVRHSMLLQEVTA